MISWMFPGQGSQFVGMADDIDDPAREVFDVASEVLGWDVLRVCARGPEERLGATEITQPAVFTAAVATAPCTKVRRSINPKSDLSSETLSSVAFRLTRVSDEFTMISS